MYDIAIIGAGIAGSYIARELTRYKLDIVLLDGENDVGNQITMANSAIVHAGFDAPASKLKGKFNTTKKSWDFPIKAKEKVEMAVYMIFGMSSDAASEKVNIELTFLESVHAAKSSVIIAGRIIAKATSKPTIPSI